MAGKGRYLPFLPTPPIMRVHQMNESKTGIFMGCLPVIFGIAVAGRVVWFSVIAFLKGPQTALDKFHFETLLGFIIIFLFAALVGLISIVVPRLRLIAVGTL
jgi:hypothetical protein